MALLNERQHVVAGGEPCRARVALAPARGFRHDGIVDFGHARPHALLRGGDRQCPVAEQVALHPVGEQLEIGGMLHEAVVQDCGIEVLLLAVYGIVSTRPPLEHIGPVAVGTVQSRRAEAVFTVVAKPDEPTARA